MRTCTKAGYKDIRDGGASDTGEQSHQLISSRKDGMRE